MTIQTLLRRFWPLSPDAKRLEEQLARKLSLPEEPDYTASLISRMGFVSMDKPGQLMDYRYTYKMPMVRRVVEIDLAKPLEKELKRARNLMGQRMFQYKKRTLDVQEAQLTGDWDNLKAVPVGEVEAIAKMADNLGVSSPHLKGRSH